MSRFREIQEERARQAMINQSRASGDSRQKVNQFVGGLRDRLGGMRENMGNRFSAFKNVVTNPNAGRQAFGSSPLQQAMAQRDAGMLTPQGEKLLQGMAMDPDEMARQESLMAQGRHGDYGIDRRMNPTYTNATTNQVAVGPPEKLGDNPTNMSAMITDGKVEGADQMVRLHKDMKNLPQSTSGIKAMQTRLNSLGYTDKDGNMLKVDGKIGPLTASAMDKFNSSFSTDTGEALDPVSYTYRDARLADHTDSTRVSAPPKKWDPFNIVKSGTDNIQETIGNPANDPVQTVMWGTDELSSMTNPLQYDFESGEVFDPYK